MRLDAIERAARRAAQARGPSVPRHLRRRWVPLPGDADAEWRGRVERFRVEVIPWLDRLRPLDGARILEVGSGSGASTICLAEQGARVAGIDAEESGIAVARSRLASVGLDADLQVRNATNLLHVADGCDWVVFWAVLEHMTIGERLTSLSAAWSILPAGGLLTVIETPNRLWPHDSHTSRLPFFSWLPYELGYRYSRNSPRAGFADAYLDDDLSQLAGYLRRGFGASFHEFDLAIADHRELPVRSMQVDRRDDDRLRRVGWRVSRAGRTAALLQSYSPETDAAWFQPFLYLTLTKG